MSAIGDRHATDVVANAIALNGLHISVKFGGAVPSIYLASGLRKPTQASRTC